MSLQTDLFSKLGPLVQNRVYPSRFPLDEDGRPPQWPAIRYVRVSNAPASDLCGDGEDDESDIGFWLDVVAIDYATMWTLRNQVRAAIKTLTTPVLLVGEQDGHDSETNTHRCRLDYVMYQSSAAA